MNNYNTQRLDYADALRCLALLLGIVFHASLSFMPMYIGWAVMDVSTSDVVPNFVLLSHSFRMPLFFLIAGFFSHLALRKKGLYVFVKSRFIQIAIPLVCGWFVLRPLLVAGWYIGAQSMQGDANISEGIQVGYESLYSLPASFLVGTHLWFLYYLLLITMGVLLISLFVHLVLGTNALYRLKSAVDKWLHRVVASRFFVVIVATPCSLGLWFMQHWQIDTPDKSLVPHVSVLCLYAMCFILGWLIHRQASVLDKLGRLHLSLIILCVLSITITIMLAPYEAKLGHANYTAFKAIYMYSYAVMMWCFICLSIAVCKACFAKKRLVFRYFADASYWLYLIHLPIVIFCQIAVAELALPWSVKLVMIVVACLGVSIFIYDIAVRPSFIGRILNSKRKKSVLLTYILKNKSTYQSKETESN